MPPITVLCTDRTARSTSRLNSAVVLMYLAILQIRASETCSLGKNDRVIFGDSGLGRAIAQSGYEVSAWDNRPMRSLSEWQRVFRSSEWTVAHLNRTQIPSYIELAVNHPELGNLKVFPSRSSLNPSVICIQRDCPSGKCTECCNVPGTQWNRCKPLQLVNRPVGHIADREFPSRTL